MWITIESVAVSASGRWQTLLLAWCERDESLTWWWQDNHHSANGNLLFLGKASFSCSQRCTYGPSIFFFPHNYPLCWWSINLLQFIFYHSRSTDFEEKIEGLWTAQQANIFNNYAFKRYVWFSLHHFALWLSHRIFCICLRNCWWLVIITGGWAICIGCFMYFDQIITDRYHMNMVFAANLLENQFWCCPRVGHLDPIFEPHRGVFVWMPGPRTCDMKNPQLLSRLHLAWELLPFYIQD